MKLRIWTFVFVFAMSAAAQKRPLTHQDYDSWRSIQNPHLSADGVYLGYALFPQEGDGEFVVRNLKTGKEWRESIGARPPAPPPNRATLNPEDPPPPPPGVTVAFSRDGRTVVFSTFPPKADVDKAHKEKKKPEDMAKNGMVILDLASGKAQRVERVRSFQVPEAGDGLVAYLHLRESESASKTRQEFGGDLVLKRLSDGNERI